MDYADNFASLDEKLIKKFEKIVTIFRACYVKLILQPQEMRYYKFAFNLFFFKFSKSISVNDKFRSYLRKSLYFWSMLFKFDLF